MGSASDYGAQMLSHDLSDSHENLVFDLDGQRVYGMTFSNWVMLMSLHKCARTMCYGLRLRDLVGATVRWRSRGLGRGRREEEEKKKRRGGRGVGVLLYPQEHAYLPKVESPLHLPCLSMLHVSIGRTFP